MKAIKEQYEIDCLKNLTYTEINSIMNMLNNKINKLEKELKTTKAVNIDLVDISKCDHDYRGINQIMSRCSKCGTIVRDD